MPTILQERLADEIVKNSKRKNPLPKSTLVRNSGYKESVVVTKSTELIESKGVKEIIRKKYNITEDKVNSRIGEILDVKLNIKDVKPDHILRASDQGARILGMYAPEKHVVATADLTVLLRLAKEKEAKDMSSSEADK